MNETEWLASTDPAAMLRALTFGRGDAFPDPNFRVSDRKLRLFAQACEVSFYTTREPRWWQSDYEASHAGSSPCQDARYWANEMNQSEQPRRANILRDIIGNPFRPWHVVHDRWNAEQARKRGDNWFWAGFRTRTVFDLAHRAYDQRDFAGLPILADALLDVGCDNEGILRHLRGEYEYAPKGWYPYGQSHVRGCWCLDLILGKE